MTKSRKIIFGIGSLLLVLLLAGGLWLVKSPTTVTFAQEPVPTTPAGVDDWSKYQESFLADFATRLGVTVEQIKQAFADAFNTTVDQALTDGALTQDQADRMKERNSQMLEEGKLPGLMPFGKGGRGGHGFDRGGMLGKRGVMGLSTFATALGITEQELFTELQSGKSLAQVVTEKNGDLEAIKSSYLEAYKAKLDEAVAAGRLTQEKADEMYSQASDRFDTMVNQTMPAMPGGRPFRAAPQDGGAGSEGTTPINPTWGNG